MLHGWARSLALLLALAVVGLSPGRVWAAAEGGEPNIFDPSQIPLGVFTVIIFLVLLAVLKKYAWGPMLDGLHRREQAIRGALDEARQTRDEAARLKEELQRQVGRAHETVREILDEARRDAEAATADMTAKARADIQAERDRARRELLMARDQALQELTSFTANLATLVSAKVIRRSISEDDHRRLVDEALAELKQAPKPNGHTA
jgi:F-type H+-transporting ATPase subunit b